MENLESEEASYDSEAYEQGLEEGLAAYEEVLADLDEVANTAIEVSEDYEELYAYIYDYYDCLYSLTEQAVGEIEYLMSLVPTPEDIQQIENQVERLENISASGQLNQLSSQLTQAAQKVLSSLRESRCRIARALMGA